MPPALLTVFSMNESATASLTTASTPCIRPINADAFWALLSKPHPVVGKARHLGEALIQAGLISPAQLDAGLRLQSQERSVGTYRRIGQILVESGALTQEQLS